MLCFLCFPSVFSIFPSCVFHIPNLCFSYFPAVFVIFPCCVSHISLLCFSFLSAVFFSFPFWFSHFPSVFFIFPFCVFHNSLLCFSYFNSVFFLISLVCFFRFPCCVFHISMMRFSYFPAVLVRFPCCVFHVSHFGMIQRWHEREQGRVPNLSWTPTCWYFATSSTIPCSIVGKTRRRRRHVCAIFQACCAFFASGHAINVYFAFCGENSHI